MKQVDLKNILETQANLPEIFYTYEMEEEVLRIMREVCNQTVDLCAENADITINSIEDLKLIVDKQSILDTKKQIV